MYNNRRFSYEVRSRVPRVQTVRRMSPVAVVFLLLFIVGACVGSGFLSAKIVSDKYEATLNSEPKTTIVYRDPADSGEYLSSSEIKTPVEVAKVALQSIVGIYSEEEMALKANYADYGSGVIISKDGYVVTAYHVVKDLERVKVKTYDGAIHNAEWIKGDAISDIAIVKISAKTQNYANIGRSENLEQGEQIVAIGNPIDSTSGSVILGNVKTLGSSATIEDKELINLIKLACPLNYGDSGSGVFNMQGRLIGIVNARGTGNNINDAFASPIDDVLEIAEDIIQLGYVEGRVDTSVLDLKEITNSASTPAGLYFMKVNNTNLHISLKSQDYIISVAGVAVSTIAEWEEVLNSKQVGSLVEIKYRRDGIEGTIKMPVLQRQDCD